jgi:hypothetical protein
LEDSKNNKEALSALNKPTKFMKNKIGKDLLTKFTKACEPSKTLINRQLASGIIEIRNSRNCVCDICE